MAAALFSACNDVVDVNYPDRYTNHGAPSITGIYDVQDTGLTLYYDMSDEHLMVGLNDSE